MRNWLTVPNPFGLQEPPKWWLRAMRTFDDQLVIFPSQKDPVFRLARRSRLSAGIEPSDVPGVANHPDTVLMRNHGLVPVTTVVPGAIWDDRVFTHLAERDTWRMGGPNGSGAIRTLEALDEKAESLTNRKQVDELDQRSHDAYDAFKYRTGQRVSMAHKGAAVNKRTGKRQFFDRSTSQSTGKPFFDVTQPRVVLATA